MLSDLCLSVLYVTLVYYGQMVGRIKVPLGTKAGLSTGSHTEKGHSSTPTFWPMSFVAKQLD